MGRNRNTAASPAAAPADPLPPSTTAPAEAIAASTPVPVETAAPTPTPSSAELKAKKGEPITVKFTGENFEPTERVFSKEVHGDDFAKVAAEFTENMRQAKRLLA